MTQSCLLIKPDAYNRGLNTDVRKDVLEACDKVGLKVVFEREKLLTREDVLKIYPTIYDKSFPEEYISLMISNFSLLIVVSGDQAINKTKQIRGHHKFNDYEQTRGIRGKYCYVEDVSNNDLEMIKLGTHPHTQHIIAVIIEGIIHAPDVPSEVSTLLEIFNHKF